MFLYSNPQRSLDSGLASGRQQAPPRPTASLPASLVGGGSSTPSTLPSYDQCVPEDSPSWVGVGTTGTRIEADGSEEVMDENDRIAMQEAEDERLAREMLQKEEDEVSRGTSWGRGGGLRSKMLGGTWGCKARAATPHVLVSFGKYNSREQIYQLS